jgi:hypothetical protein
MVKNSFLGAIMILRLFVAACLSISTSSVAAADAWSQWAAIENPPGVLYTGCSVEIIKSSDSRHHIFMIDTVHNRLWHKYREKRKIRKPECTRKPVSKDNYYKLRRLACDPLIWGKKKSAPPDFCDEINTEQEPFWVKCTLEAYQESSVWSNWESVGKWDIPEANMQKLAFRKDMAVAENADGLLQIFIIDYMSQIWTVRQISSHYGWGTWDYFDQPPSSAGIRDIVASANEDRRPEIFVTTVDNVIFHRSQIAAGGAWEDWESLGMIPPPPADPSETVIGQISLIFKEQNGKLSLIAFSGIQADFIARFGYGYLWLKSQKVPGGIWESGWNPIEIYSYGNTYPPLRAITNIDGRVELWNIARGPSGQFVLIFKRQLAQNTNAWSNWNKIEPLPYNLQRSHQDQPLVTGTRAGDKRISIFVKSQDHRIWYSRQVKPGAELGEWQVLDEILPNIFVDKIYAFPNEYGLEEVFAVSRPFSSDPYVWRINRKN